MFLNLISRDGGFSVRMLHKHVTTILSRRTGMWTCWNPGTAWQCDCLAMRPRKHVMRTDQRVAPSFPGSNIGIGGWSGGQAVGHALLVRCRCLRPPPSHPAPAKPRNVLPTCGHGRIRNTSNPRHQDHHLGAESCVSLFSAPICCVLPAV